MSNQDAVIDALNAINCAVNNVYFEHERRIERKENGQEERTLAMSHLSSKMAQTVARGM